MSASLQICNADSINDFDWSNESQPFQEWLTKLAVSSSRPELGTRDFVANVETKYLLARLNKHVLPLSVNDSQWKNSYVCSPYSGAISYPLVEVQALKNRCLRAGLTGLIHSVAPVLRGANINRVVCVNNLLLSTNLYPQWDGKGLRELRGELVARYPKHAILLRSLNQHHHSAIIESAKDNGFILAPSRQIYIVHEDQQQSLRHQNCRKDQRLLRKSEYSIETGDEFNSSDNKRIKQLYDQLYLEKYTSLNPQFTEQLIRCWRETKSLSLVGLRNDNGLLDGVVGCIRRGGVLTAPLVGYDTSIRQSAGLYRMLTALIFQEAFRQGDSLNLSSGAAGFKRLRGGKPWLEYTAVYCRHLPFPQRQSWKALGSLLTHVGGRVLKKYQL